MIEHKKKKRSTYRKDGAVDGKESNAVYETKAQEEQGQSCQKKRSNTQKKMVQSKTLGHNVQKKDTTNVSVPVRPAERKENRLSSGDNFFEQEEQQRGKCDLTDSFRNKDTYFQSDAKTEYQWQKRRKKNHRNHKSVRDSRQSGDEKGKTETKSKGKDNAFTEDRGREDFKPSKKLEKLEEKAEKARKKTDRARKNLPKKKEYNLERRFNEVSGKTEYVLNAVEKEKPFHTESIAKRGIQKVTHEGVNVVHEKVAQYEKDNSGLEALHKAEQSAERGFDYVVNRTKTKFQKRRRKVAKLEQKQFQADTKFLYQKYLEENPQIKRTFLRKRIQKERIKREYAKAYKKGKSVKNTKETVIKNVNTATAIVRKMQEFATRNMAVVATMGAIALALVIIVTAFSSCGAMLGDTLTMIIGGSYLSNPEEIDKVELVFTKKELALQNEIDGIESNYPGYDEYRYNIGEIGHDPFTLISYLSALYNEFTATDMESHLSSIFTEMYTLTTQEVVEIRTRTETQTSTDPVTGEESSEEVVVEYEYFILEVTLTVKPLSVIAVANLSVEQKELFDLYQSTNGNLQQLSSPLDLHWYYYVSSYYGYRKNPSTEREELHRGIDIAVPEGTEVYAAHTGIVTTAAYNSHYGKYIEITDSKGIVTKYAHLSSMKVDVGQTVEKETVIGTTGNTGSSTGSHLHLEVLFEGIYYNPIFYFAVGEITLNGETPGAGSRPGNVIPPDSYDDATVQALMREAERYLGMPYTFGGTPPTSFDCSAFVCWVFTNSGVHNLPRTTAQGIYDQCTSVSASEAKAGDIIFFTGTYNAGRPVTHVGIYCGDGIMVHCGNPIQYTSTNTSYWQSHFYGYGRLN